MQENYNLLLKQAESLIASETDIVAVTANLSALLFNGLDRINWLGFYFLRDSELVLGPFQGNVACTRIPVGQGVCGTAFKNNKTLIVDDVHLFRGHIACDAASESEIVVPFSKGEIAGVLDVDSPQKSRFGEQESALLEAVVALLVNAKT